jgi:hypothetical protein
VINVDEGISIKCGSDSCGDWARFLVEDAFAKVRLLGQRAFKASTGFPPAVKPNAFGASGSSTTLNESTQRRLFSTR